MKTTGYLTSQRMAIRQVGGVVLVLLEEEIKVVIGGHVHLVCPWASSQHKAVETALD